MKAEIFKILLALLSIAFMNAWKIYVKSKESKGFTFKLSYWIKHNVFPLILCSVIGIVWVLIDKETLKLLELYTHQSGNFYYINAIVGGILSYYIIYDFKKLKNNIAKLKSL